MLALRSLRRNKSVNPPRAPENTHTHNRDRPDQARTGSKSVRDCLGCVSALQGWACRANRGYSIQIEHTGIDTLHCLPCMLMVLLYFHAGSRTVSYGVLLPIHHAFGISVSITLDLINLPGYFTVNDICRRFHSIHPIHCQSVTTNYSYQDDPLRPLLLRRYKRLFRPVNSDQSDRPLLLVMPSDPGLHRSDVPASDSIVTGGPIRRSRQASPTPRPFEKGAFLPFGNDWPRLKDGQMKCHKPRANQSPRPCP